MYCLLIADVHHTGINYVQPGPIQNLQSSWARQYGPVGSVMMRDQDKKRVWNCILSGNLERIKMHPWVVWCQHPLISCLSQIHTYPLLYSLYPYLQYPRLECYWPTSTHISHPSISQLFWHFPYCLPYFLLTYYCYLAQLPPPTIWAPIGLLPTSATHQPCLTMTVATTNHCHMQLPILDWSVPMITASCNSHCPDHLPLSVSIAPSPFGSIVLTVALPCNHLVSLLSIFPPSIDTQCPVFSVDPLSPWLDLTPFLLFPTVYKLSCHH